MGEKVFFIWGSMCAACVLFAYFCIPETKGLSLEQVELLYQHWSPGSARSFRTDVTMLETPEAGADNVMEKSVSVVEKKDGGLWESAVETIPVLEV